MAARRITNEVVNSDCGGPGAGRVEVDLLRLRTREGMAIARANAIGDTLAEAGVRWSPNERERRRRFDTATA